MSLVEPEFAPWSGLPAEPPAPLRVLLADDSDLIRDAILAVVGRGSGVSIVGQAGDGESAVSLARSLSPDLVLMDASMPGVNGLEAARRIGHEHPGMRVIMLLPTVSADYERAALRVGAVASVAKDRLDEDLLDAISSVTSLR
jgi:DNA-binding NarL/FixJ family response regulator